MVILSHFLNTFNYSYGRLEAKWGLEARGPGAHVLFRFFAFVWLVDSHSMVISLSFFGICLEGWRGGGVWRPRAQELML